MGVSGLIGFVKNAVTADDISHFANRTCVVDVSCWLHRGVFACAHQMARGEHTDACFTYVVKYVKLLHAHNIRVILVFDGSPLPAKEETNAVRSKARRAAKARASELSAAGRTNEAASILQKATEVTWEVVADVILKCRRTLPSVDIVVAPYESDAQLAFLCAAGYADFCVTEDSDLIVYGVQNIVFKLDPTGKCQRYDRALLPRCLPISFRITRGLTPSATNENFDFVKFRRVCILSGCDYLPVGLPGVGLKRALDFFTMTSCDELERVLRKIPTYLNLPSVAKNVDDDFVRMFVRAERTFLHQIVYDPIARQRRPLTDYPPHDVDTASQGSSSTASQSSTSQSSEERATPPEQPTTSSQERRYAYAGRLDVSPSKCTHLALGNCNPRTMQRTEGTPFCPDSHSHGTSLWRCSSVEELKVRHARATLPSSSTPTVRHSAFATSGARTSVKTSTMSTSSVDRRNGDLWTESHLMAVYGMFPWSARRCQCSVLAGAHKPDGAPPAVDKRRRASVADAQPNKISTYFPFRPPIKNDPPAMNPFKKPRRTTDDDDDVVEIVDDAASGSPATSSTSNKPPPPPTHQFFRADRRADSQFRSPRQQLAATRKRSTSILVVGGAGNDVAADALVDDGDIVGQLQQFLYDPKAAVDIERENRQAMI